MTGANDYRADQYNIPLAVDVVVRNIGESIVRLHALGARTIMVLGLPDLGRLPYADPAASRLTLVHNTLLHETIEGTVDAARGCAAGLRGHQRGVRPAAPGHRDAVPALAAYGAQLPQPQPQLAGCLFADPSTCRDAPFAFGTPFLFRDIVHPTTGAHRALGDYYLFARLSQ